MSLFLLYPPLPLFLLLFIINDFIDIVLAEDCCLLLYSPLHFTWLVFHLIFFVNLSGALFPLSFCVLLTLPPLPFPSLPFCSFSFSHTLSYPFHYFPPSTFFPSHFFLYFFLFILLTFFYDFCISIFSRLFLHFFSF